ncbi:MAG: transglycosylase domain-containing protein [Bacteroidales bacterium]|nr:transglycosylase domain-containing protein [Bacteroidales bacterium]
MKSNKKPIKKRIIIWLTLVIAAFIAFIGVLVLSVYLGVFGNLPTAEDIVAIDQDNASLVYASDGTLMGKYYLINRQTIDNELISPYVRQALIATEDNRFFEHHGLDLISLGRVIVKSVLLGKTSQGGGSTISQQLAKNLYKRKSYGIFSLPVNKIKEIFIASRLEDVYNKEEILTLYLNTVAFGEDVYGIEAAAWRYFNKPSVELDIPESATLVGMLAANTAYSPRLYPERSATRRNTVLSRMVVQGFITEEEADKYKEQPIQLDYNLMDMNRGIAPYFRTYIRRQVNQILKEKYGDTYNPETDGLRIYTSLDITLQSFAEQAVAKHMKKLQAEFDNHWKTKEPWYQHPDVYQKKLQKTDAYKRIEAEGKSKAEINKELEIPHTMQILTPEGEQVVEKSIADSVKHYLRMLNTGFMAMDPKTGAILAWVGGINHKYIPYDHVLAERQVGSTFKPLVYTTALNNGMTPCQMFANEQHVYEDYDDWSPSNSEGEYEGWYSMKGGLKNSVNTITAEIMMETGPANVIALARELNIDTHIPEVPSIALGTAEISLFEMVEAYTAFSNNGYSVKSFGILRIEDSNGDVLYEQGSPQYGNVAFTEDVAAQINDMLQGVVNEGTGRSLRSIYGVHSDIAGKTGTTQNNADGWFIGYTPDFVAGVWVGAELPVIHFRTIALGSGAHMALPVFGQVVNKMENNRTLTKKYLSPFPALTDTLLAAMDCPDFSLEKPDKNFFDIVRDIFAKEDSAAIAKKESRKARKERKESVKKKEKEGFFKRIGNIFKRKKKR